LGLFLLAGVSACDDLPRWYPDDREDPVAAARGFLAAARRGDCEQVWTYFSAETQAKIREQSRRVIRSAPYNAELFAPHRIHCSPYESYRPSTVRLASSDGRRASVRVMERVPDPQSFALPGWSPIGRKDDPRTIDLTRAPDGWKVLPHVPEDPRAKYGETTYDIGRAVIVTRPGKRVEGRAARFGVEGSMPMDVAPADLERALADPEQWPRFWPHVTSARWLGPEDAQGYRPLAVVFALPDGPREGRVFFHQAGRVVGRRVFSFGFASEYLYSRQSSSEAEGSGRLRWAATFFAGPGPRGGSIVRWGQSIDDARLAHQDLVASQLEAFEREAKMRSGRSGN
jgi:hypothetical protein